MKQQKRLPRESDPQFDREERLFRALRERDVEFTVIQPSAVDLQGTSVYREAYLESAEQTFEYVPDHFRGLAYLRAGDLPVPMRNDRVTGAKVNDDEVTWEFFVVDDPYTDDDGRHNLAHAEVRTRRVSDRPGEDNVKPSAAMKALLRKALARKMVLLIQP